MKHFWNDVAFFCTVFRWCRKVNNTVGWNSTQVLLFSFMWIKASSKEKARFSDYRCSCVQRLLSFNSILSNKRFFTKVGVIRGAHEWVLRKPFQKTKNNSNHFSHGFIHHTLTPFWMWNTNTHSHKYPQFVQKATWLFINSTIKINKCTTKQFICNSRTFYRRRQTE